MTDFLGRLFQVRPEEWGPARLALGFAFLTMFTTVLSRTLGDALFLSAFDASWIPTYVAASALGAVVFSGIYMGVQRSGAAGVRRNAASIAVLGVGSILVALAGLTGTRAGAWVFGVGTDLFGPAINTVVWTVITAIFHSRQSKRLLPLVGAAATVGAVIAGLLVRPLIGALGSLALVLPSALLFLAIIPLPKMAHRFAPEESAPPPRSDFVKNLTEGVKALRATPLVASLAAITFLLAVATNLIDVQFLTALQTVSERDGIGMFLGSFHAVTNGAVLILQTFVLGRLFSRFGVRWTFLAYPAVLLMGSAIVAIIPLFYVVAAYRGVDKVLKFTGHYGGVDLVLAPVRDEVRDRARAFLRGGCNPAGALLAGSLATPIAALLSPRASSVAISVGVATASALAIMAAFRLRRQYVDELQRSLRIRVVNVGTTPSIKIGLESEVARLLTEALDSGDAYLSNFALDVLAENLHDGSVVGSLLGHRETSVRRAAMEAVAARPQKALGRAVLLHLSQTPKERPSVVAAGLKAIRIALGAWPGPVPSEYLDHRAIYVRVQAYMLALVGGDADAESRADAAARAWAKGDVQERTAATHILGEMVRAGSLGDRRPILEGLLDDEDASVRIEAVRAAGPIADAETVRRLIALMEDRDTRAAAEAAIAEIGEPVLGSLVATALDAGADRALRHSAVHALSRVRVPEAIRAAGEVLVIPDPSIRTQAAATIRTLRRALGDRMVPRESVLAAMKAELAGGYRAAGLWDERVRSGAGLEALLLDALDHRMSRATEAMFGLAGALHGADWVEQALARYRTGSARTQADAVEVLDVLMQDPEAREILSYLDRSTPQAKARHAKEFLDMGPDDDFASAVLFGPDRYLALCLVRAGLPEGIEAPAELTQEVESMSDQFERVLLLKSVSLFSELSGEDLLPVAEVARTVVVERGAEVVTQGQYGDDLYVIVRGKVEVIKDGKSIGDIGDKGCFGELAVLDREPRAATIRALARTELLRIGRQEFDDLMDAHPALTRGILKVLLGYVRVGKRPQTTLETPSVRPP